MLQRNLQAFPFLYHHRICKSDFESFLLLLKQLQALYFAKNTHLHVFCGSCTFCNLRNKSQEKSFEVKSIDEEGGCHCDREAMRDTLSLNGGRIRKLQVTFSCASSASLYVC